MLDERLAEAAVVTAVVAAAETAVEEAEVAAEVVAVVTAGDVVDGGPNCEVNGMGGWLPTARG